MQVEFGYLLDQLVEVIQGGEDVVPVAWVRGVLVGRVSGGSLALAVAIIGEDGGEVMGLGGLQVVDDGAPGSLRGCEAVEEDEEDLVVG